MSSEVDGIRSCNSVESAVEPLINLDEFKARWLFGILPIISESGETLSDEALQSYLNTAVSIIEHDLDISLIPRTVVESKDYQANDYYEWGYFHLNNIPVIDVTRIDVVYMLNGDQIESETEADLEDSEIVLQIPKNWIRLKRHAGEVRLIPSSRFPANLAIDSAAAFFPELFNRHSMVPDLWRISYSYGFQNGKVPTLVNAAVGMMAAIMAMNIAGDLRIGSGIASISLNLDGMSQAINSTASAENHTYSAKVKEYGNVLFGQPGGRQSGIIKILRDFYRGETLQII